MEKNEKKHENPSNTAIIDVISSMVLAVILLLTCNEVITKRQNPRRLAAVFKICWEVLFAIL
jgi:hypothetical protein